MSVQVMRRQKTPQKQDRKLSESADVSTAAAVMVTDAASVTGVATPGDSVSATLSSDVVSYTTASPAATTVCHVDASAKTKTPQTRKARSRIAANFGAFSPQS